MPRPAISTKPSGRPTPCGSTFQGVRRKSSGRCCATPVSARNSRTPSRRRGCSRLLLHAFLAYLGPIFGGLRDDIGGLFLERRHALLCPEDPKLAVSNRPGVWICFVSYSARDHDGAITVEPRRVVVRIGDEQGFVLGILEQVGRIIEGSRKFGRSLPRMAVGEIRNRVVALQRNPFALPAGGLGRGRHVRGDRRQSRQCANDGAP